MPQGRGKPCDSNAPIESLPHPLHLLLWPLTGLQEWVWGYQQPRTALPLSYKHGNGGVDKERAAKWASL